MATSAISWSGHFHVAPQPGSLKLTGDKIVLPPSALEQLLSAAPVVNSDASSSSNTSTFDPYNHYTFAAERHARAQSQFLQQQLPYPLTFRLVNSSNNRVVYAGIREFSAEEGTVGLSPFLAQALGLQGTSQAISPKLSTNGDDSHDRNGALPEITVHASEVRKGTFVKLRPLEAGYDPEDWRSLLEDHMRKNFTTLSRGEVLTVPAGKDEYQFLIDSFQPEGDAVCVVDTDLEVDIEALNEEQARETLKRIADKARKAPGTVEGSSKGGDLAFLSHEQGQVLEGEYVDYQLPSWSRSSWLEVVVDPENIEDELNLFASPLTDQQRARPRADEHVFGDFESRGPKRLRLSPTNVELENAEALWISVYAPSRKSPGAFPPRKFTIRASPIDEQAVNATSNPLSTPSDPNESICPNCHKPIPSQSLLLHEGFCRRNNIACPKGCGQVFQKNSQEWTSHWHCPHDSAFGNTPSTLANHDDIFHTPHQCPSPLCNFTGPTLPALAQHRTTTCPGKLHLCRFCHLVVPQEGDPDGVPNAESIISGLTPHEIVDGGRTTECHLCARIVRLRDMATHMKNHDLERNSRPRPRICRNVNCGRTLDGVSKNGDTRAGSRMGQGAGNDVSLCSTCFGPLYVATYDPEGKALRRRVERRYLSQLVAGCGKAWCRNEFCRNGRTNLGVGNGEAIATKDALPMVKSFVDGLSKGTTPLHFCVDETSQKRRGIAELLAAEGQNRVPGAKAYDFEWCVAALEAEGGSVDKARDWLANFAPDIYSEAMKA